VTVASHEPVGDLSEVPEDRQPHERREQRPSTPTLTQHRGNCGRAMCHLAVGTYAMHRCGGGIFGDAVRRQISPLERLEPHVAAA